MRLGWGTTGVNWMGVIRDMDGGDIRFLGLELGWDRTHESGSLDWGHFQISRPVWVWDGNWIEFRCTSWDLHQVRCGWELKCYSSIPHLGERRNGWRWIAKIGTWLGVRCKYIVLNGGETLYGWRWDNNHASWMQVRQDMDGCDMHISRPVWVRNQIWM